jgi:DNA-binding GntR family transcriptional regulator
MEKSDEPVPIFGRRPERRRPPTLAEDVTAHLRTAILTGALAAGEFIRIDAVARELGVSITPVREALVSLQGDGFVELLPNRGFRVLELSEADIDDAYLVQRFVAGELAARAAERLSDDELDRLEAIQAEITSAHEAGDSVSVERANQDFHRLINRAAGAPKLGLILRLALHYVPQSPDAAVPGWQEATATDHRDILTALRGRDAEGARIAMVAHIDHARRLLIEHRRRQDDGTRAEEA